SLVTPKGVMTRHDQPRQHGLVRVVTLSHFRPEGPSDGGLGELGSRDELLHGAPGVGASVDGKGGQHELHHRAPRSWRTVPRTVSGTVPPLRLDGWTVRNRLEPSRTVQPRDSSRALNSPAREPSPVGGTVRPTTKYR